MRPEQNLMKSVDSFAYRHRVGELMSAPVATIGGDARLTEAAWVMSEKRISSLIVVDKTGQAAGIVTERDVLRTLAHQGEGAARADVGSVMSSPVTTIAEDSYIYAAIGRMDRLSIRHLLVTDAKGMPVGMISARTLLKLRSGTALALGDEAASAETGEALRRVHGAIPPLARALVAEGMEGPAIAQVISQVLRDITVRAAQLALISMKEDGWGEAPAPWCLLILGSGGRGESLFSADQDNAIIHESSNEEDPWFGEMGKRMNTHLDTAGIPFCKGGVMAMNPPWRRSLAGWKGEVDRWIARADGEDILNIDIFLDFAPILGERRLASELRAYVLDKVGGSKRFLRMLSGVTGEMRAPVGMFGRLKTDGDGRLDIKTAGLLPLVSAVRVMAIKNHIAATATPERLRFLGEEAKMNADEAADFIRIHALMLGMLLRQQLADDAAGAPASTKIDPKLFGAAERRRLVQGFKTINALAWLMEKSLN